MQQPTLEQQENLLKLAKGLLSLPADYAHFDMECYADFSTFREGIEMRVEPCDMTPPKYNECGTVACAAGHGPLFVTPGLPGETWDEYIKRVFGIDFYLSGALADSLSVGPIAWKYLFGPEWEGDGGGPWGAAARIVVYLRNGCKVASATEWHDYLAEFGFEE